MVSMLKSVSYAQSVNEERYMLKGVFFPFNKRKIIYGCNRWKTVSGDRSENGN